MSSPPQVSVLLPVRDGAAWLLDALQSLGRQTFRELEIIAADDGSRDATPQILEAWSRRDPRLRSLRCERRGIAPALAGAADAARGEVFVRQDADDISHPDRIRRLLETLAATGADVVGSRIRGFPRSALTRGMARYEDWQNSLIDPEAMRRERFVESPLAHASAAIRREALEKAGGWQDPPWPEDLDLWLRMFRTGARFAKRPEELYFWRERPDRTTRTDPRLTLEAFRRCKIHHLGVELLGDPPAPVELWSAGRLGKTWREDLEAAGYRVHYEEIDAEDHECLPRPPDTPLLLAIGNPGHRQSLRNHLSQTNRQEQTHYACVY